MHVLKKYGIITLFFNEYTHKGERMDSKFLTQRLCLFQLLKEYKKYFTPWGMFGLARKFS